MMPNFFNVLWCISSKCWSLVILQALLQGQWPIIIQVSCHVAIFFSKEQQVCRQLEVHQVALFNIKLVRGVLLVVLRLLSTKDIVFIMLLFSVSTAID